MLGPLVALILVARTASGPETDPRLAGRASCDDAIVSLEEAVAELGRATKVPLVVAPDVRDRKVTLVFTDRSVGDAMGALARCLFLVWKPEAGGYRLTLPPEILREEARQRSADTRRREAALRRVAKTMAPLRELTFRQAGDAAIRLLGEPETPTAEDAKVGFVRNEILKDPAWTGVARALAEPATQTALAEGRTVYLTNPAVPGALPLTLSQLPDLFANGTRYAPQVGIARLRLRPGESTLVADILARYDDPTYPGSSFAHTLRLSTSRSSEPTELERRLAAWSSGGASLDALLDATKAEFVPGGYRAGLPSIGDHLRHLAATGGLAIVGDAFRLAATLPTPPPAKTVREYLEALRKGRMRLDLGVAPGAVRVERGWLMVRHDAYWRLLPQELPERWVAPLEARVLRGERLGLDDYATLAARMDEAQADGAAVPLRDPVVFGGTPEPAPVVDAVRGATGGGAGIRPRGNGAVAGAARAGGACPARGALDRDRPPLALKHRALWRD